MKEAKKEILTEHILRLCKEFENVSREEIHHRLDMSIDGDLGVLISEHIFWWFVDRSDIYEEPDIFDIGNVVDNEYLKRK